MIDLVRSRRQLEIVIAQQICADTQDKMSRPEAHFVIVIIGTLLLKAYHIIFALASGWRGVKTAIRPNQNSGISVPLKFPMR